jgi:hypothetical protein
MSGTTNFFGTLQSKGVEIDASTGGTVGSSNLVLGLSDGKIQLVFVSGGTGSGSTGFYSGASPTTCTVGGLTAGSAILGCTYDSIIERILVPALCPSVVGPSNSFTVNESGTIEVGYLCDLTFNAIFSQGSVTPAYCGGPSVRSGLPNTYCYLGSGSLNCSKPSTSLSDNISLLSYKVVEGTNGWCGSVSYDAGLNVLNSVGGVYLSALAAGSTSFVTDTFTGRFCRFYGPSASTPATSAQVRALCEEAFQTSSINTFCLNTDNVETKFVVGLPPSRTITCVIDLDALNVNITSEYVCQGTITVQDGGGAGDNQTYNLYEMNLGAPYSSNHRHLIETS